MMAQGDETVEGQRQKRRERKRRRKLQHATKGEVLRSRGRRQKRENAKLNVETFFGGQIKKPTFSEAARHLERKMHMWTNYRRKHDFPCSSSFRGTMQKFNYTETMYE